MKSRASARRTLAVCSLTAMVAVALCGIDGHGLGAAGPPDPAGALLGAEPQADRGERGGRIVLSQSAGPRTFNCLSSYDQQTNTVCDCLMGHLIRINRQTQQPEAELAQSWSTSSEGKALDFHLRQGVRFSDGHPFTADDVLFTFQVINDPKVASAAGEAFEFDGRRVKVERLDKYTVRFTFPIAFAAALRAFDGIAILPKHILEAAHRTGNFEKAWTLSTPAREIVGLGPFKLRSYTPGQRVILARNEHYWKPDPRGERLPYLDELVFDIDPDRNTQLLKFQKGDTDILSPVNAEELSTLGASEREGKIRILDLGSSLVREIFWFNLNEGKHPKTGKPFVDPTMLGWFKDVRFRQAISHAIDRGAIVDLVFRGKAAPQVGFVSSGNRLWLNAGVKDYPHDLTRAKRLLAEAGFRFREEGNLLVDREGRPVTFTVSTNAGNVIRQKMSALMQEDLAKLGIKVNLAFIESRALLDKINSSYDYEACLLALVSGDMDPSSEMNVLLSSGSSHWWHPRQARPATSWEARIDELMNRQMVTLDQKERKRLFDEVQVILAEQLPFTFLVSRHLIVAAKTNLHNLRPALLPDFVLWNCDELYRR